MPWIIEGDDHIGDDVGGGEEEGEERERQNSILPDMDVAGMQEEEEGEGEAKPAIAATTSTAAGRGIIMIVVFFSLTEFSANRML